MSTLPRLTTALRRPFCASAAVATGLLVLVAVSAAADPRAASPAARGSQLSGETGRVAGTTPAAPAASSGGVYGGTTRAGEAFVLRTDRAGTRVRSAVLGWDAQCDDGDRYPASAHVTAVSPRPGFDPNPTQMVMRRNRAGRFSGTITLLHVLGAEGDRSSATEVKLEGRIRRGRASGTLSAQSEIFDATTAEHVTTCRTGRVRWSAARAAGRIWAGATSQDEPFVARMDARARRIRDVYVGWRTRECTPPGGFRIGDSFVNFAVDHRGRWGASFDHEEGLDDGGRVRVDYAIRGRLGRTSARGSLSVAVAWLDAAGATSVSCKTGTIRWTAATG